jgi:hypothetical protein
VLTDPWAHERRARNVINDGAPRRFSDPVASGFVGIERATHSALVPILLVSMLPTDIEQPLGNARGRCPRTT